MNAIEYFIPKLNGWLNLSLETYLTTLFSQEEKKLSKIKIPKGLPINIPDSSSQPQEELSLSPGNFVEVLNKQNLILESINEKGRIQISNISNGQEEEKTYDVWSRGKIISSDTNSKILFVELNDNIIIIDNFELVRPLKEVKPTQSMLIAYNLKQIQSSDYNLIKDEFDKVIATSTNANNNKIFYIKYDVINSSLLCLGNKDDINSLLELKKYEENFKKNNNDEQNSISDLSNPNSNNNLIGVRATNPSSSWENSESKNIAIDNNIKNEINEYKFKSFFTYRDKFRKDMEKNLGEVFQKCKYYVGKNKDNNFDIILYSNNGDEFMEEKSNFEKEYKQVKIESDIPVDKNEVKELAIKSNIKYFDVEKKNIYLVGETKNINNFKEVWDLSNDYTKDFQKINKEKDIIQKELQTFKKKNKIK